MSRIQVRKEIVATLVTLVTPKKWKVILIQESKIEKRLKKEVEKIGGKALKFVSPGLIGVPDRIVLLPHGKMIFVELKAPGKKLEVIQDFRAKQLRKLGFNVKCIDSIEGIMELIKEVKGNEV